MGAHRHRLSAAAAFTLLFLAATIAPPGSSAMGVHRHRFSAAAAFITLFFFATALGSGLMEVLADERVEITNSRGQYHHLREEYTEDWIVPTRRRLRGPGSSPPTCRARCGTCFPCRPVHVVIQPGRRSIPLDYYPEAWRCKCGNKLFMP